MPKKEDNIDKKLAEELAAQFWSLFDDKKSKWTLANGETLEVRKDADGGGEVLFTPKTVYFDKDKEIVKMTKEKVDEGKEEPAYILEADYSDDLNELVVWSLDDRSE